MTLVQSDHLFQCIVQCSVQYSAVQCIVQCSVQYSAVDSDVMHGEVQCPDNSMAGGDLVSNTALHCTALHCTALHYSSLVFTVQLSAFQYSILSCNICLF